MVLPISSKNDTSDTVTMEENTSITESSAAAAEKLAASAEEMAGQAESPENIVGRFKRKE